MKKIIFFFLLLFVFSSCKKEKDCSEKTTELTFFATDAVMPSTAKIGETVPMNIYYDYNKGCEVFGSVNESANAFDVSISLSGNKNECACSSTLTSTSTTYNAKFHSSGTYSVKFLKADGSFISKTIVIQ